MRTFLGIPITQGLQTDAEYVALIRRQLRVESRVAWFGIVIGMLCFVAGLGVPMMVLSWMNSVNVSPFQNVGFAGGLPPETDSSKAVDDLAGNVQE